MKKQAVVVPRTKRAAQAAVSFTTSTGESILLSTRDCRGTFRNKNGCRKVRHYIRKKYGIDLEL